MVVKYKKTGEVCIWVDLRKLNDAFLHDTFPTPLIDEVLENVGGQEVYYFTVVFLGYHQVKIAKEDRDKTTFLIEWGCFQYTVIPFGFKNAPSIFSRIMVATFKIFIQKFLEVYFDDSIVYGLIENNIEVFGWFFNNVDNS